MLDSVMLEPKERERAHKWRSWLGRALFIGLCLYLLSELPRHFKDGEIVFGMAMSLVWPCAIVLALTWEVGTERVNIKRLKGILIWLVIVGLAVAAFDTVVHQLPYLRSAKLPYPDVRLDAAATRSDRIVTHHGARASVPALGHSFVMVDATIRSVYGHQGEELALHPFELRAEGRTYEYSRASFGLINTCSDAIISAGGVVSCKVVFEVPDTLKKGILSYGSLTGYDKTEIRF